MSCASGCMRLCVSSGPPVTRPRAAQPRGVPPSHVSFVRPCHSSRAAAPRPRHGVPAPRRPRLIRVYGDVARCGVRPWSSAASTRRRTGLAPTTAAGVSAVGVVDVGVAAAGHPCCTSTSTVDGAARCVAATVGHPLADIFFHFVGGVPQQRWERSVCLFWHFVLEVCARIVCVHVGVPVLALVSMPWWCAGGGDSAATVLESFRELVARSVHVSVCLCVCV